MKKNILYVSQKFNLACGVSKNVFTLLTSKELQREFNLYFIANGGDALSRLEKANINFTLFNFKTDSHFHLDLFRDLKQLRKFCEQKKIDIIHSHHRYPEFLSNHIKKSLGVKTIMTAHNFVTGFNSFSYKSDYVIAISHSVKKHLTDTFPVPPAKIKVLYNCIKSDSNEGENKIKIKCELNIPQNHFVIFYAGRIVTEKGIGILAEAFRLISKANENISLLIVGESNSLAEINSFNLNGKNIFVYSAEEDLIKFYAIADLVVLPSVREPFGYIMIEAGLYKVPFIGSRNGGIVEFIEDEVNGYLFEPGNAMDLAEKIKYISEHSEEAKLAAEKLYQKVLRECSCTNYFSKLNNIYQILLSDKSFTVGK